MKIFEKKLKDYLTLFKIPIGPDQLDPTIFSYSDVKSSYVLLPQIANQIIADLEHFAGEQPTRIEGCYIVGDSILPGNKNRNSDLEVLIVLNKNLMDADIDGLLAEELLKLCNELSGRLASGSTHPIRYTIALRKLDPSRYEGVYDLKHDNWLKLPNGLTNNA